MIEFYTPEQVAIQFELAGVGSRAVAATVDGLLQLVVIGLVSAIPAILVEVNILPDWDDWSHPVLIGLGVLVTFAILWGYYIFFEALWNGETPGKRLMGLRVIKDGGYPVDFRSVVIRNLIRAVDMMPGVPGFSLYGIGILSAVLHTRYQRLGDMAAGTLVIRHGREEERRVAQLGQAVTFRLLDHTALTQLARLTREEYQMAQRFLERRQDLPAGLQSLFAQRLAQRLIARMGYQEPELGMDYLRWLEELDLAYRQRALGIASAPTPAPEPAGAPAAAPAVAPVASVPPPPVDEDTRRW